MPLAAKNRSSASGPPRRGAGGMRTPEAPSCSGVGRAVSATSPTAADRTSACPPPHPARGGEESMPCDDARSMTEQTLASRLLAGDRRALAGAISLVENDRPEGWELVKEVYPHTGHAEVVGFTGPPGAGKSTLIG